jgi:hypothetical protein
MSNVHLAGKGGGNRVPYVVRALQVKVNGVVLLMMMVVVMVISITAAATSARSKSTQLPPKIPLPNSFRRSMSVTG